MPWIRLTKASLPPHRLHALLRALGTPDTIFGASRERLVAASGMASAAAERLLDLSDDPCETDLAAMGRHGVDLIPWGDARYPSLLGEISDPPCALYARGSLQPEDQTAVAIVGTRRPTTYGREVAEALGRDLARVGVTVVSGMAAGIDSSGHRGALSAGGRTLAVLGCGVDVVYPAWNGRLQKEIVEAGAVLSEYPMGSGPERWRFPARNRIVSGLALGVVVVEGPARSGVRSTIEYALEQGREVFAVPGDVRDPRTEIPHRLIQEGAKLVRRVEDILDELRIAIPPPATSPRLERSELALSEPETRVLTELGLQPRHVDLVIEGSGLTAGQVSAALLTLELKGLIRRLPGNAFVRLPRSGAG